MLKSARIFIILHFALAAAFLSGGEADPPPRLVVVLSVDQMRADFLDRFGDLFTGGLKYLIEEGVVFANAHHEHAITSTGPAHFVIGSGRHPGPAGIIGNSWYDRTSKKSVYCVEDRQATTLDSDLRSVSYRNVGATALGDWLKGASPSSKVYSISVKDRSAVLMGGKNPNGVFWFDSNTGRFITSDYYMGRYPEWLNRFHASRPLDKYFGRSWERSLDVAEYDRRCRPDDYAGEDRSRTTPDRTFPHLLAKAKAGESPQYGELWNFPFLDEALLYLATAIIDHERLGGDDSPDIINIGLSMADGVGHRYGPFSHEVMEMFLSLDSYLGAFFRYLDIKVGLEHVLIALTADHGAGYLPEYAQELGLGGGRYGGEAKKLLERLNRVLFDRFGAEKIVETASAGALFYDLHLLHEKGLQASDIDRVISPILKESEWIEDVIPSAVLESNQALTPLEERYRNIHHPTSSGDLYYMPKRHWISKSPYGASHGTPYDWDSHVPMVFAGNRIQGNTVSKRIMTIDLAPTLAARLGLEIPSNVDGKPLELGTIDSN